MHGNIKETKHSVFAPWPYFRNLVGGTKILSLSDNSKGGRTYLSKVSRDFILFDIKHCGGRDYQRQYIIKEKNSRWGFTVIKRVRDSAWPQINLHFLCSHGPKYRALITHCVRKGVRAMRVWTNIYKHACDKEIATPNTKTSKELYEYKNIKERKGNKAKRKSW